MPRIHTVKAAQQRYVMVPVIDPATGQQAVTEYTLPKPTKSGRTTATQRRSEPDLSQPLPPETCEHCRQPIAVGSPYMWVKVRRAYGSTRRVRHTSCPRWQEWDLSDSLGAQIARIVHEAETAMEGAESADDVTAAMEQAASEIRELAEAKREAQSNMEEGFGHATSQSDELGQMADELDSWADEVEGYSPDDAPEPDEADDEADEDEDEDDADHEAAMDEWRESVLSEASDLLGQSPA